MFTGIIEEMGRVLQIPHGTQAGPLTLFACKVLEGTQIGDSISVNGVCLTVTKLNESSFSADVTPSTLRASALGSLQVGSPVNLERALPVEGRLGGHIVSGHIDGTGRIAHIRSDQNALIVSIEAPCEIMALVVERGSIAIDGISLTVAKTTTTGFSVSVIPHTAVETTLVNKKPGDLVNLENDIVGKYVQRLLGNSYPNANGSNALTLQYLQANGF